jgi:hypothetical protein
VSDRVAANSALSPQARKGFLRQFIAILPVKGPVGLGGGDQKHEDGAGALRTALQEHCERLHLDGG